jgi:NADH:ubiquinone oxidoreductase subunit 5 (subunit L)/multisubunit Na+/H+ antiporter MnhA subunit
MPVTVFLILFPLIWAFVIFAIRDNKVRGIAAYIGSGTIIAAVGVLFVQWLINGRVPIKMFYDTETADHFILTGEIVLMLVVTYLCFKYHKYWISILSIVPTLMLAYFELAGPELHKIPHVYIDHLSMLMCLIVGIIGGMIIVYAVGYMDGYAHHHPEFEDRRNYFLGLLFFFLSAMFGFVMSESLLWIDLFWETTSVCSFLLIGYTRTDEAVHNSFRALWMNLAGGVALAVGIIYFGYQSHTVAFHDLIDLSTQMHMAYCVLPVALIAFAALTKAAQYPFSTWLIGAMVAPTPSSALLHSATMVKAGIYVLLRLAPAMAGTLTGTMITFIGGFTFFVASIIAIGQSDGKRVLAFSTISNLGLMVACAGVGAPETVWAGVLLMIFHAVSKSLLFQDVGATENAIGSRDIEDMHGLLYRLPRLATFMFIGIAGMFLAPFGMLISKWSALRAAVDESNILLVLFIVFGSATTSFYWTKWMGKLISRSHETGDRLKDITKRNEVVSLTVHAALMILLCILVPFISKVYVDPLLIEMFGKYEDVLPMGVLYTMIVVIAFVFLVPIFSYFIGRKMRANVKLTYMSGINTGDNTMFVDSLGEPKRLWLSNYYFRSFIHPHQLRIFSQILTTAVLLVMMSMIIGGAL